MARELDVTFRSMGSDVRLLVGPPATGELPPAEEAARRTRDYIEYYARSLTRFDPSSELCALNRERCRTVPASRLMRAAVTAGVYGARRSGGLVDPTLIRPLERAGYASSREGVVPVSLAEALEQAPPRQPAAPDPRAAWREIEVDDRAGLVRRPPGLLFDSGGIGKGLAAEAAAQRLAGYPRLVVDCGGDIALRGEWDIQVEHPLTGECVRTLRLRDCGVATSGLNVRVWRRADGSYAHHLIDPSTGEPAWTGLIGATAVAPTALDAEILSKLALLSGPAGARAALAEYGGIVVHDDGDVELIGPVRRAPRLRVSVSELAA
jgi:thiamine biosynthesis lipoprotein